MQKTTKTDEIINFTNLLKQLSVDKQRELFFMVQGCSIAHVMAKSKEI